MKIHHCHDARCGATDCAACFPRLEREADHYTREAGHDDLGGRDVLEAENKQHKPNAGAQTSSGAR
jgi:hypothetical protein